jgi:ADP-heptose:LPS heptosyltransferase
MTMSRPAVRSPPARRLVLTSRQAPGDIVMLTAAVRDLHRHYPGRFVTDVRTPFAALWEHNPDITSLDASAPSVEVIACHYPLIHRANAAPVHFLQGFVHYLNCLLDLQVEVTTFGGAIYLSDEERASSSIEALTGGQPYWVVVAGGKRDFTIKWWDPLRYQEVVDRLRDRHLFVQVGAARDCHPALSGVINLRGQTDLRRLIRLIHHADGVLTPVSLPMHLAAAVPPRPGGPKNRPCVVIAGGREPPHWEAYPHHQFIHTVGSLMCCDDGGCWKSRTRRLGDGQPGDRPENLCVDVRGDLPACMDMITAGDVARRIELYRSLSPCA